MSVNIQDWGRYAPERERIVVKRFAGKVLGLVFGIVLITGGTSADADWRTFGRTYDYMTMHRGGLEAEIYTDVDSKNGLTRNQVEIEYGLTNNWQASVYGVTSSGGGKPWQFSQIKLQTRYRFGQRGQFVVDPAVYLEYKIPTIAGGIPALEAKIIAGKQLGQWNTAANLIYETNLTSASIAAWKWSAGFNTEIGEGIRVGLEGFGDISGTATKQNLGPVISMPLGASGFRLNTVIGFGLNQHSDAISSRTIVAYNF